MSSLTRDKVFGGSIATLYEQYLVPLLFEPYAADMVNRLRTRSMTRVLEIAAGTGVVNRLRTRSMTRVLEIAAGTGVVTRALASALPARVAIVATDLNQPMLDRARECGTARPVEWRQADAMQLPFEDESFDAVVCQFGVMFFTDKTRAFAEALRVLKPRGVFVFSVWDRIEENEFADTVTTSLQSSFPDNPPRFLARTPHGYHDRAAIEGDLADAGFVASARIATVAARSRAESFRVPAVAYCQGTPLRTELEAYGAAALAGATDIAAEAIAKRFGRGPVDARMQGHVVTVEA